MYDEVIIILTWIILTNYLYKINSNTTIIQAKFFKSSEPPFYITHYYLNTKLHTSKTTSLNYNLKFKYIKILKENICLMNLKVSI